MDKFRYGCCISEETFLEFKSRLFLWNEGQASFEDDMNYLALVGKVLMEMFSSQEELQDEDDQLQEIEDEMKKAKEIMDRCGERLKKINGNS